MSVALTTEAVPEGKADETRAARIVLLSDGVTTTGRAEAYGAVAKAARELGERASLDALIRAGLRELSQ